MCFYLMQFATVFTPLTRDYRFIDFCPMPLFGYHLSSSVKFISNCLLLNDTNSCFPKNISSLLHECIKTIKLNSFASKGRAKMMAD